MTLTDVVQSHIPDGLVATVDTDGITVIVALGGEADIFTLPIVVHSLAQAMVDHSGPVVIDLTHTNFIDIGAARAIAHAGQFLNDRGRVLTVRAPSRMATRLFGLLGLTKLIEPERMWQTPGGSRTPSAQRLRR